MNKQQPKLENVDNSNAIDKSLEDQNAMEALQDYVDLLCNLANMFDDTKEGE